MTDASANPSPLACDVVGCTAPPVYECRCPRCLREPDPVDRDHVCEGVLHGSAVNGQHWRRTGRRTEWRPLDPAAPAGSGLGPLELAQGAVLPWLAPSEPVPAPLRSGEASPAVDGFYWLGGAYANGTLVSGDVLVKVEHGWVEEFGHEGWGVEEHPGLRYQLAQVPPPDRASAPGGEGGAR